MTTIFLLLNLQVTVVVDVRTFDHHHAEDTPDKEDVSRQDEEGTLFGRPAPPGGDKASEQDPTARHEGPHQTYRWGQHVG